uniref:Fibronectin type-III domain-containing protein n=1 Tax=Lates calcarifer TaxID=8187 RepID=A0A4W6EWI3_LATCA
MRCNDAMKTTIAQQFPEIKKNLKTFEKLCFDFKVEFQRTLAKKLPLVRGGDEEESVLAEILEQRHISFNNMNLNEWMDCIEEEIYTLMSFTNKMKNTKIVPSENDLYKEVHRAKHTVCFVFTLKKGAVPYLSVLTNYLKEPAEPYHVEEAAEKPQWFSTKEVLEQMRHKAKLFIDFAEANKENNNIQFLTVSLANENTETKGTSIYHYEDGKLVNKDFEPPAEPEIESGVTHNSVTLSIRPPRFGAENITCYSVEYCVSGEDEWRQRRASRAGEVTVSGLTPNTEYMFRCRAECSAGVGPAKEICDCIKTLPTSPPINLLVESTSRKISVVWERPVEVGPGIHSLSYIVEYTKTDKKVKCDDLHWNQMVSSVESAEIDGLEPGTDYAVRVRCECGVDGRSGESRSVDVCTKKCTHLIELLKCTSKCINSESPSVYKLPLTEEDVGIAGCRMYRFGKENMGQNRTIILLGETGSGKSTLINAMINHIVGVEWSDSFRFRITDEAQLRSHTENRTSEVTVYKINHQDGFTIPFSLMVVDTPGFMSTRGIETDKEIKEQIDRLFTSVDGVSEVDAVCFVTPASISCITPIQKYTFDSMLSIFGKDVAENIMVLVTFADGKHPPVIEAMKALGVNCPQMEDNPPIHFKFNNSALFEVRNSSAANNTTADDADENESLNEMFWSIVTKSMRRFFVTLNVSNTKSLTQTKEVLRVRSQLEHSEENLLMQFKLGLAIHERIKKKAELLEDCEAEITRTENFEFEFLVKKIVQNDISLTGHYITNCKECQHTCHYPCSIQKDEEKNGCSAIGSDGHCTKCPGKCKWTVHVNQSYWWEYGEVREKQTVPELKEKYENATEAKTAIQTQIEELLTEYESVQDEVMKQMETSDKCLNRLKEIALKPNPLSTPGYIDMLIEGEKSEAKPGWRERVHSLIVMREKAEHIAKFLPLQTEQESHNILF